MDRAFAYVRVSTPRQGEKGVSLVEQRDAIARYAERHQLQIVQWFEDQESASKKGRTEFNRLLRLLRLGSARKVIIHKIDRSARNLEDWNDIGKLVDSGVEVHFATEDIDLRTTAGRLSADIQAVVAAHYSRNLRDEVKKGLYGRLKQGFYPWGAPVGYLDQGAAKPKIPDPIRGPLIAAAYELYSTGSYSLPQLVKEMYERGLRNRNGGAISVNGFATILHNPFYIGLMRVAKSKETYRGNHEPLVPTALFERVQAVLSGKRVDRTANHVFCYSRFARCASCKYSLIAESQKGHVYYRCHDRPFKNPAVCPLTSVREEQLDSAVIAALEPIQLSDEELAIARACIAEFQTQVAKERASRSSALRLHAEQLENRLSKLADLFLDGSIEKKLFESKQRTLLQEQAAVREKLKEMQTRSDGDAAQLERTVELAKDVGLLYKTASVTDKRALLKSLLSNFTVSEKNVEITLAIPFQMIADRKHGASCGHHRGTCRTWTQILRNLYEKMSVVPNG